MRKTIISAIGIALSALIILPSFGNGLATVRLTASRIAILNNGHDSMEIIAEVRDSGGNYAPDGTQVTFDCSTPGVIFLGNKVVGTRGGSARIRLVGTYKGVATVRALSSGAGFLGGEGSLDITFTDDPNETYQGNTFVRMLGTKANLYSANQRVVEATGKIKPEGTVGLPGAHLVYRNTEVWADRIQLDCTSNAIHAYGDISFRRGNNRIHAGKLYYNMTTGDGFALVDSGKKLQAVKLNRNPDKDQPVANGSIAPQWFEMADIADSQLIISAHQIVIFPGDKLQFARPTFYQDGARLFSMPYYSLAMYSQQLFTDQFVSVGSQGLGVDVPFYYDLTPGSTGIFYLRHNERSGRNVYATRPGWSLDLVQGYNSVSGARFTGQFGLTGINRSDWGVRMSHSQEFSQDTRGSLFLDFPQHRSIFGSGNLTHQMGQLSLGMNLSASQSIRGFASTSVFGDAYLETLPKKIGKTGYMYALGGTTSYSETHLTKTSASALTEGVHARFYSTPFQLGKGTTLTNFLSIGNQWSSGGGASGINVNTSLVAEKQLKGANLHLGYEFNRLPIRVFDTGSHKLSFDLTASPSERLHAMLLASTMLDSPSSSFVGELNYLLAPRWRFSLQASMQKFVLGSYRDIELGISRTVLGRDLVVYYSTFSHRFFFDFEASRF